MALPRLPAWRSRLVLGAVGDGLAHRRVCLNVLHPVVVHDAEVALVAGLAVFKVLNGVNLLPIAAFFVPLPVQLLAGVLPTYWPMRAVWSAAEGERYAVYLVCGAVVVIVCALLLTASLFDRRLRRQG
jgi:hypothetical protein